MDLQQRLQMLGHYKGDLNVVYDLETARAVASAQESLDLHPDGTVNLYTLQALVSATDQKLYGEKMPAIEIIDNTEKTEEQELVEDLVQIITVFSCKLQGKRANKAKKMIKELAEDDKDL